MKKKCYFCAKYQQQMDNSTAMRVGILYIGIGRYACFWDEFYSSSEQYLLRDAEKHYYVFTDGNIQASERVHVFHQDDMGWPCNSLFRFKMFHRIREQLAENDYLFFFNSNAKIVDVVEPADILPVEHDFCAMCMADSTTGMAHESRPASLCCVAPGETDYYFSGAMNGGKATAFLQLIEECNKLVDAELNNGVMPVWHDETVLNRFLIGKRVKIVRREMGKPANWSQPSKGVKVILRTKEKVLGRGWLRRYKGREHTNTWLRKLLRKCRLVK